jgi:excisionase family DNA binding protein
MARRYNIRRVKIHRTYTVAEVCKLLRVHKHTVGRWIASGLPLIDRRRPYLIHGTDLREFLAAQQPQKHPLQPGEMYCLGCRAPRRPAGKMADFAPRTKMTGTLIGICPECECFMHRAVSLGAIDRVRGNLAVAVKKPEQRIADTSDPLRNVVFKQGPST